MTDWRDISTAPRDGSKIWVIEAGCSGVHEAHWMNPCFWIAEARDLWPSRPTQWHPFDRGRKPPHPYAPEMVRERRRQGDRVMAVVPGLLEWWEHLPLDEKHDLKETFPWLYGYVLSSRKRWRRNPNEHKQRS